MSKAHEFLDSITGSMIKRKKENIVHTQEHVKEWKKRTSIVNKQVQTDMTSQVYLELIEKAYLYDNLEAEHVEKQAKEMLQTIYSADHPRVLLKSESMPSIEELDKSFFEHYDSEFGRSRILTCPPLSNGTANWSESVFDSIKSFNDKPRLQIITNKF